MSSPLPKPSISDASVDASGGSGPDEVRVLAFERDWTGSTSAKEAAIRSQLDLSATRYYRLLHRAIDDPNALEQDPLLVRRLQRLRSARTRIRASRTYRAD
ncbi:MAG: DUF3263 domain-containing protein [Micrococcales bacterium]|nr:DUF3263 domain-containing protein [Micrococcales bacterium]